MLEPLSLHPLGATNLQVPSLCVGCAALGDMPGTFAYSVAEAQALVTIRAIFEGPISFVDTAASYGDGESERRIGVVLRERGGLPAGFVLSTKADRNVLTGDFSGDQMCRSVERSLKLLGVDRLQICYLHDPEHIGFAAAIAPGGPVEALNAAPYGSGILAKGPSSYPRYMYGQASDTYLQRAFSLEALCLRYHVPLAAVALQFSLRDPRIASTIVGISKPERLRETLSLAQQALPEDIWEEIAELP
jgi:aryl-alcohol dehydrogenase-like predicted oxidoreductase